ncbi:MAG TPA: T9SS type A sorting domain-containing protein [Flavitalea sp.]|nr:T9SS type A sorting domain-containing protein [Flavitalea sp.]
MKLFYILSFILLTSLTALSQSGSTVATSNQLNLRIIKFYPNPANSIINFDFESGYDKNCNFQIFSFVGKKVFELNNLTPKTIVNLNDFYRGIYIFQLRDRNGKVIDSGKFQVSK